MKEKNLVEILEKYRGWGKGLTVEAIPKEILYEGNKKIKLKKYLDSNPKYHNWSRACDVGH